MISVPQQGPVVNGYFKIWFWPEQRPGTASGNFRRWIPFRPDPQAFRSPAILLTITAQVCPLAKTLPAVRRNPSMQCNRLAGIAVALVCAYPVLSQNIWAQADSAHARHLDAPLSFEANQGQADRSVQFLARGADYHLMLSRSSIVLRLRDQDHASAQPAEIT